MRASKLIEKVQDFMDNYGDLEIVHHDDEDDCDYTIHCIEIRGKNFTDSNEKVMSIY